MEFREAAEIARQRPGSTLTRDDSGAFIVRLEDGSVIRAPIAAHAEIREKADPKEIERLRTRCENLERIADARDSERAAQAEEIAGLRVELVDLWIKTNRVQDSEWERVEESVRQERAKSANARREQVLDLVRLGGLSFVRLQLIIDASEKLDLSADDLGVVRAEVHRKRMPRGFSYASFGLYATTDGQ